MEQMMKSDRLSTRLIILFALITIILDACAFKIHQNPTPFSATPTFTPFQPLFPADISETLTAKVQGIRPTQNLSSTHLANTATLLPLNTPIPSSTSLPKTDVSENKEPTPTASSKPKPPTGELTLWIDPLLPTSLEENLVLPVGTTIWEYQNATLRLEPGKGQEISRWIYALVAPFPTIPYSVSSQDLIANWHGKRKGAFKGQPILLDESTYHVFKNVWGEPATGAVQVIESQALLEEAWKTRPSWAILPFEALEPRWKVLAVNGQSPLQNNFDPQGYFLSVPIGISGNASAVEAFLSQNGMGSQSPILPPSNRDPDRLTVLAMTGVTALVRATAYTMEQKGVLYPGKDVRNWLREADLTHISNEVPFAKNCPYPNPVQKGMIFCSRTRYIKLLEDVGTDIVELTGDHFADWGETAMYLTLDMYRERGWPYYGGGANLKEGRRALLIEQNGNRLAFIGCNAKGGSFAQAAPGHPGAVPCDRGWMIAEIKRLRYEGYLPIVTFQHYEYYTYRAQKPQKKDFRAMAEAGAVIVSGSQAHQPQALEFKNGALIHYGLGNLFFDQYDVSAATRKAFIDRHIFYNGRYIGSELLPIVFIDYARPRPMTPAERKNLLNTVFAASGW
jgi:poly-gamma-glutamate synthesis protein (capsule biosynthesis protein)